MVFEDEFIKLCYQHYDVPVFNELEFEEDMLRISIIKKLISRYQKTKVLNTRIILNHIIILRNVFGLEMMNVALFYKIDEELYPLLKTLLQFNKNIMITDFTESIDIDQKLQDYILQDLKNTD